MRRFLVVLIAVALTGGPVLAQQETENLAAFARLYGVARWFYPSDAAAGLDWNRFAVEGVRRVRGATTTAQLTATLSELFMPLGPGFEIGPTLSPARPVGARNASLIAWHYRGPGFVAVPGPYTAKRMNRVTAVVGQGPSASRAISQAIPADSFRGKAIRLRGMLRVGTRDPVAWAGLWMRVDRTGGAVGFFDNMQDRPVRDTTWREYVIEGQVADDAVRIVIGILSVGSLTVDADAIELAVRGSDGTWKPVDVPDASFESAPAAGSRGWFIGSASVARPAIGAPHGAQFLRIMPQAAPLSQMAQPADSLETPLAGASVDFELARGLKARVALSLTDAEARSESPALAGLRSALATTGQPAGRDDPDVRVADVIVAWNVFRHFYPYWGDISVNWDARLRPQIDMALRAPATREAHVDAIRMLVSDLRDGHGSARDAVTPLRLVPLPVQFRILEGRLVVTASRDTSIPVGSVVTAMNGVPASTRVAQEMQLASGTAQWQRTRAEGALQACIFNSIATLTIEPPAGATRDARVACTSSPARAAESRPDSITELQPGVWYVDLTRIQAAQLRPMIATLSKARGVIFDVRGYPTDAGAALLPHLMSTREDSTDRWMHVPRFSRPFGEVAAWQSMSWNLQPATPHIGGQRVFLTDGRAISYAESVMGYVRDYKLGTIIGSTTAGANGNVAGFSVPGGISISFTGMRVTRHDGRTPYHTVGVSPEIPLEPTLAGIRAGRDEVLQRALTLFRVVQ